MYIKYYFKVRRGKRKPFLEVDFNGFGGDSHTVSGKSVQIPGKGAWFKMNAKESDERWAEYFDYTINENDLQVEFKGPVNHIAYSVENHYTDYGCIRSITFEGYE